MTTNTRPPEPERPGRYRPGSRRKRRNLVDYPVRRAEFDVEKFGKAIINAVLREEARRERAEKEGNDHA